MCDVHSPFYTHARPVARLVHRCDECYLPIMRGERHVAVSGVWDGEAQTWRAHELCDLLASRISVEDGCRIYGYLVEAAAEVDLTPFQARVLKSLTGRDVYTGGE